jgi:hypothetical protein
MTRANLADGYIETFSRQLTEREKATRLRGEFFHSDSFALAELFNRPKHLIPESALPGNWKQEFAHCIALDPHPQKPTYACMIAAAPNGKRYYVRETSQKIVPREFARWLKANWLYNHRIIDIICDSSGNADYTGGEGFKSFIEVLQSEGIRVRATTYDEKSDEQFLTRIQDGLYIPERGEPSLQFLEGASDGIVRDILNCMWQPIKNSEEYKPKLEISNRDYLATLKYALSTNLTFEGAKRKVISTQATSPWSGKTEKKPRQGYMERAWGKNRKDVDDDW